MDLVEHLGVEGTLAPPTEGWGASVELIELVVSLTLLPLSIVAGVVTLTIGVTDNIQGCHYIFIAAPKWKKVVPNVKRKTQVKC